MSNTKKFNAFRQNYICQYDGFVFRTRHAFIVNQTQQEMIKAETGAGRRCIAAVPTRTACRMRT
jgi:hypothetical protein